MSEVRASKADMVLRRVLLILSLEDAELVMETVLLGFPGIEATVIGCREKEGLQSGRGSILFLQAFEFLLSMRDFILVHWVLRFFPAPHGPLFRYFTANHDYTWDCLDALLKFGFQIPKF